MHIRQTTDGIGCNAYRIRVFSLPTYGARFISVEWDAVASEDGRQVLHHFPR
jgi:hypothetical protein